MKKFILACFIFSAAIFPAFGEEVYLNNGRIIPGTIVSSDTTTVNLKTDYGNMFIERKDILKIEYAKSVIVVKNRKFALALDLNPYFMYTTSMPFWAVGISYFPMPKSEIQVMGSYFSLYGTTQASVYTFYGYPFKLSESPEVNLYINGGLAYKYTGYSSYYSYSSSYDYSQYSVLFGVTFENFPISYLPNFGYRLKGGISYTWYAGPIYSYYSINSMGFYFNAGLAYYLF